MKKDDEGLYKCEARNEAGLDMKTAQLAVISKSVSIVILRVWG